MKLILLTGMSGTGKTAVIEKLGQLGHKAVDLDTEEYSEWVVVDPETADLTPEPDRDWMWKEDKVKKLLSTEDSEALFVSGTAENMGQFLRQFDHVILLSASPQIIKERLATRTNNSFGKEPHQVAQVLALIKTVEPLLRKVANHEIDTSIPLDNVVDKVLSISK